MIIDGQTALQAASRLALALLIVSAAISFIRLVRGPQAADRVVALDLISVLIVAFLAAYAVHSGDTSFLDVAIAYALVAFLGTVALSRFLLRSRGRQTPGGKR
ncbi:MAG: cation:proton antiporter [Desulfobacterales bacterium]|jgi:multicomponent Na+:H+ antiporter subunit F|nr:cation:proton antiporter [Desulfobacterales bacterium]MDZ7597757.1 cation:proton antiporter [Desulfobacterales bacterium]